MSAAKKGVVLAGAGGHAKVVLDILLRRGELEPVGLIDRDPAALGTLILGVPVLGGDEELVRLAAEVPFALVTVGSIGDAGPRRRLFERIAALGYALPVAVHPAATVAPDVALGEGTVVMAAAVLNPGVRCGANVIVNTGAIVDHDCRLGAHAHVAPGAVLSGSVDVGEGAHVGVGASVRQGVRIGAGAIVGAGAAVITDVESGAAVAGVPARALRAASH